MVSAGGSVRIPFAACTEMSVCGCLLSSSLKSAAVRPFTGAPDLSVTTTSSLMTEPGPAGEEARPPCWAGGVPAWKDASGRAYESASEANRNAEVILIEPFRLPAEHLQ